MNRASKIFLVVGGVYLLLLIGIILAQPKAGYSPSFEEVLFFYLLFVPLFAGIIGIYVLIKKHLDKYLLKMITAKRTLYTFLIVLVIVGFVFNLDYLRQIGCFVENEQAFAPIKFILSGSSILLLTVGYLYSNNKFGITVLIVEFLLWTMKSLYYNDSFDLITPGYFTLSCWAIRYSLIAISINRIGNKNEPLTKAIAH